MLVHPKLQKIGASIGMHRLQGMLDSGPTKPPLRLHNITCSLFLHFLEPNSIQVFSASAESPTQDVQGR